MREKVNKFVLKNPMNFLAIVLLYALATYFFPYSKIAILFSANDNALRITTIIFRLIFLILPLIVFVSLDKNWQKDNSKIVLIAFLLVCLDNIPFVSLLTNQAKLSVEPQLWLLHICYSLSVSVFEEIIFRGLVFVLILQIFSRRKHNDLIAIFASSAIFALFHFLNLLNGDSIGFVFLTVGYTFLTGGLFCIAYFITKNIFCPIVLHFFYNLGGLLDENGIIFGMIWSKAQIIVTIIISIIAVIIAIYWLIKIFKRGKINESSCAES